jgi:hypothetical protein
MPINKKIMGNMRREYGAKKGTSVYYAKENKEGKLNNKNKVTTEGSTSKPTSNDGVKDPKEIEESVGEESKEKKEFKTKGSAKAALRHTLSMQMAPKKGKYAKSAGKALD